MAGHVREGKLVSNLCCPAAQIWEKWHSIAFSEGSMSRIGIFRLVAHHNAVLATKKIYGSLVSITAIFITENDIRKYIH